MVADAGDGVEALDIIKQHLPDVAMLDLRTPRMDRLEVLKEVTTSKLPSKVIIMTTFEKEEDANRAMKAGVRGYWLKDSSQEEILTRFGKFRTRFVTIGQPASLAEGLVMAANEGAISLNLSFISHLGIPNVVMVPIVDKEATWDLFVVRQRGKTSRPLRALLDALRFKPEA